MVKIEQFQKYNFDVITTELFSKDSDSKGKNLFPKDALHHFQKSKEPVLKSVNALNRIFRQVIKVIRKLPLFSFPVSNIKMRTRPPFLLHRRTAKRVCS